nr:uncharacterized protein LOC127347185 [Lolium perenne]
MEGGGGVGVAADGTEGGEAMALEGGGGVRPVRLTAFVFTLDGGAPLGPAAFVFVMPPFLAAPAVTAGGAAAAAGASQNCFGILFLYNGMVAEIMADTSPAFGGPPTGTSTTAGEGGAPLAVGGPCGGSMAGRSIRVVVGKGGAEVIGGGGGGWVSLKPFARSGGVNSGLTLYSPSHPAQVGGEEPPRSQN